MENGGGRRSVSAGQDVWDLSTLVRTMEAHVDLEKIENRSFGPGEKIEVDHCPECRIDFTFSSSLPLQPEHHDRADHLSLPHC